MNKVIDDDLLNFMGEQESQYLISPASLIHEVNERIQYGDQCAGEKLPWSKTQNSFGMRKGEVTLWAGINGHGKSNLLGQVVGWNLQSKWLIASMEMLPAATMQRMVKQIAGSGNPSREYTENVLRWTDNKLWLYDQSDTIAVERILALIRYAAANTIDHVVIDSLMKCGIKKDNLDGQAWFVDKLCWLAKANKIHVHLVHHIRKGQDEYRLPSKFDIRGAGEITDLVDNVIIIHRNKRKEKGEGDQNAADCWLKIDKQRHFSWEGTFGLFYHKEAGQYSADPHKLMVHPLNK